MGVIRSGNFFRSTISSPRIAEPLELGIVDPDKDPVAVEGVIAAGRMVVKVVDLLGGAAQRLLRLLSLGDIHEDDDHLAQRSIAVAHRVGVEEDPGRRPLGAEHAEDEAAHRLAGRHDACNGKAIVRYRRPTLLDIRPGAAVRLGEHLELGQPQHCGRAQLQRGQGRGIAGHDAGLRVVDDHSDINGLQQGPPALLAFPQGVFRFGRGPRRWR